MQSGDTAGGAVDEQPRPGLPDPVRSGIAGQCVVQTQRAAHGEAAIGHVVGLAGGPLLLPPVHEQRPYLQTENILCTRGSGGISGKVRHTSDRAERHRVGFGCSGGVGRPGEEEAGRSAEEHAPRQQRHRSGAKGLHAVEGNPRHAGWQENHGFVPIRCNLSQIRGIPPDADTRFHKKFPVRYQFCSPARLLSVAE
jgi:hypothetical protein